MLAKVHFIWIAMLAGPLSGGSATAEGVSSTPEVLGMVHHANQREILMGKMAQEHGMSKDIRSFGTMLVKDHSTVDKKVAKLAKDEKIDLTANSPPADTRTDQVHTGTAFDDAFVKDMLEDHRKAVAAVTTARDTTTDLKLKRLLTNILPMLKKHQDTAEKLVDQRAKKST